MFYDLKQMLKESPISECPRELDQHAEASIKPGAARNKFGKEVKLDFN